MSLEVHAWWEHLPNARPTGAFHATWNGKGEFYTGISTGDRVLVVVKFAGTGNGYHASLQKLDSGNASLGIWESQFHLLSHWSDVPEVNSIGVSQ